MSLISPVSDTNRKFFFSIASLLLASPVKRSASSYITRGRADVNSVLLALAVVVAEENALNRDGDFAHEVAGGLEAEGVECLIEAECFFDDGLDLIHFDGLNQLLEAGAAADAD